MAFIFMAFSLSRTPCEPHKAGLPDRPCDDYQGQSDFLFDGINAGYAAKARLGCMQTVLSCLNKKTQMTYILGDVFGVTSKEGAYIFDITPETFRKRLTRGRKQLGEFMMKHCGLVNQNNSCRCHKQAGKRLGSIPAITAQSPGVKREAVVKGRAEVVACLKEISEIDRVAVMFRRYPEYQSPESFTYIVKDLIRSGRYVMFKD